MKAQVSLRKPTRKPFTATHWPALQDQPMPRRELGDELPPGMNVQVAPLEPAFA
ncbi:MAG: hypothetical protein MUO39_06430 [Steroidobacteraceae bacterium]|nr:hypothetical protein [Steroidobacteraceae bacterium]